MYALNPPGGTSCNPPPADAKLCYDRFRISPANRGQPRLEDSLSSTTSELSDRKELRSVVESAYNGIAALSTASLKDRLARQGLRVSADGNGDGTGADTLRMAMAAARRVSKTAQEGEGREGAATASQKQAGRG